MVLDKYGREFEVDEEVWKAVPATHKRTVAVYGGKRVSVGVTEK